MDRIFKIAMWNANRLAENSQEIKTFIFSQNINILFLLETHFTNKNYFCIYILYYTMHSDDKTYGGTVLIIRSSIRSYEIGKSQRELLQRTEAIEDWNVCITISAVYSPPKHAIKKNIYNLF